MRTVELGIRMFVCICLMATGAKIADHDVSLGFALVYQSRWLGWLIIICSLLMLIALVLGAVEEKRSR